MAQQPLTIDPPPKEKGLFRVVYSIDVPAADAQQAAELAYQMMRSKESMSPILVVIDGQGNQVTLDLAERVESQVESIDLLDAFKELLSYTKDLLEQLDNQVVLDDIEPVRNAKLAIAQQRMSNELRITLKEQSAEHPQLAIPVRLMCDHGKLWLSFQGYGEKNADNGEGFPVGLEIWQGHLRVIVFDDIRSEDPWIIDLENAKESIRMDQETLSYCAAADYLAAEGRKLFAGPLHGGLWNARCLDACLLSEKRGNKAAYAFLLKYGDQYIQVLSEERKSAWQHIRDHAAEMLDQPSKD